MQFDFVRPLTFASILIWNHNQAKLTDRGSRRTRIYGSADGVTWRPLTRSGAIEPPRAPGLPYALPTTVLNDAPSRPLRSVIIAAEATDGNYGGDAYGLSAVRFAVRR